MIDEEKKAQEVQLEEENARRVAEEQLEESEEADAKKDAAAQAGAEADDQAAVNEGAGMTAEEYQRALEQKAEDDAKKAVDDLEAETYDPNDPYAVKDGLPEGAESDDANAGGDGSGETQEQSTQPEPTDKSDIQSILNYENENGYTNSIAKILDNIGNVFGDNVIGDILHNLAESVENVAGNVRDTFTKNTETLQRQREEKMDGASQMVQQLENTVGEKSTTEQLRDEQTAKIMNAQTATPILDVDTVVGEMAVADPESLANDIHAAAQAVQNGESGTYGADFAENLNKAVENSAIRDPSGTGDALQLMGTVLEGQLQNMDPEIAAQAQKDLETVTASMGTQYYDTLMDSEARDLLSEEEKKEVGEKEIPGVNVKYDSYVPGDDVTVVKSATLIRQDTEKHDAIIEVSKDHEDGVQKKGDAEYMKKSDGSYKEGLSEGDQLSVANMTSKAHEMVISTGFQSAARANEDATFGGFTDQDMMMRMKIQDIRDETKRNSQKNGEDGIDLTREQTAGSYMSMMYGIQAYNDAAVDQIREQYKDDPRKMQIATEGLAKTMRGLVGDAYNAMQTDNDAMDFLSEEDKQKLDNMQFTGVNVKFSEYSHDMDLKTGKPAPGQEAAKADMSLEEMANPDVDTAEDKELRDMAGNAQFTSLNNTGANNARTFGGTFVDDDETRRQEAQKPQRQADRESRVAGLEEKFGNLLGGDKKQKQDDGPDFI